MRAFIPAKTHARAVIARPQFTAMRGDLSARGMHLISCDDCTRYPSIETQLLADYGEVLTSPEVSR